MYVASVHLSMSCTYCIAGKFGRGKFGKLTLFEPLAKKFRELIDQPID